MKPAILHMIVPVMENADRAASVTGAVRNGSVRRELV